MSRLGRGIGQLIAFSTFAVGIGYFSASPEYLHLSPEAGLIKLNFSHAGQPLRECRKLTQEELNQLAPNMREPERCERERVALLVEVKLNGELQYEGQAAPSGVARDGSATVYQKFVVNPGTQKVEVRMRDSRRAAGFDYSFQQEVEIESGRIIVIDFEAETGGFKVL